jgi:cytochrome P450
LGVPEEDRVQLLELLGKPPTQIGGDAQDKIAPDPLALLEDRFAQYMQERRDNPRGDMMSDLANARLKDGTVPELAVPVRLAKFLFGAGQDTSARLMASTFRVLGECPHLQQLPAGRAASHPQRLTGRSDRSRPRSRSYFSGHAAKIEREYPALMP